MCVIIYKPKGKDFPTYDDMKACAKKNPDGMGLMYVDQETRKVIIAKGFFDLDEFVELHNSLGLIKDQTVVYHFRIGTSGNVNVEECHPFPVSNNINDLRARFVACDMGIAHNGVISRSHAKDMSDTQEFVKNILSDPAVHMNIQSEAIQELIKSYIGSDRLITLTQSKVVRLGAWHKRNDLWYSNLNHTWLLFTGASRNWSHGGNRWNHRAHQGNSLIDQDNIYEDTPLFGNRKGGKQVKTVYVRHECPSCKNADLIDVNEKHPKCRVCNGITKKAA